MKNKIVAFVLLLTLVTGLIPLFPVKSNPTSYIGGLWRFDEGTGTIAHDDSGSGNDGLIYGSAWTNGKLGKALDFDGIQDYVEVLDSDSLDVTPNMTIEAWIYPHSYLGKQVIVCKYNHSSLSSSYYLSLGGALGATEYPDRIYFALTYNGNNYYAMVSNTAIPLNTWTHVAAVSNTTHMSIYINGVKDKTRTYPPGTIYKGTANLRIGCYLPEFGYARYFDGIIDEARVAPNVIWTVDDDLLQCPIADFTSIQQAVNAASNGDTIIVHDGTYNEAVYITKSLTIRAASIPIIKGSQLFATDFGNREAVIFIENAADVILEGLDIEGQDLGPAKSYGILYENSSGTVRACTISPNTIGDMNSAGIACWSGSDVLIEDCLIQNFGRIGIYTNAADAAIQNNEIIGQTYDQDNLVNYGIEIEDYSGPSTAQIVENEIYNCDNTHPSPLWSSAGIIIDIWRAWYDLQPSTVTMQGNNIHNNFEAIEIVSSSLSYAHYNNIYSNRYGVWTTPDFNNDNATFDARFNWWGDASGPKQESTNPSGLGNDAGDYIDYSPWLGFTVGTSPMTYHVNPTGGSDAIQEAIDEASDGDTIIAHPGTYFENQVIVDKSLTITGSGPDVTTLDGGDALLTEPGLVRITATSGDVSFSGFKLQNTGGPELVKSYGTFKLRVGIYASSSSPSLTYNIFDNEIYGTNNDWEEEDYGFYTYSGRENMIFTHNLITQTGANPILIERHTGPTEISFNTLDVGVWGSTAIHCMTYGGDNVTTLQKISNNTIDLGTGGPFDLDHACSGITFASAYKNPGGPDLGNGTFTNVQITGNRINDVQSYRRAISIVNMATGNGVGGKITAPIVAENTVTGAVDATGNIGIRLGGLVTSAKIMRNTVTGLTTGIFMNTSAYATITYNDIENNGDGIFINSNDNVIEHNKIYANTGQFSGIHLTSTANGNQIYHNCIVNNIGINVYGVYKEGGEYVDARNNWWGDSTGPYHPTLNPSGLGNRVSNYVIFSSWLRAYFGYLPHNPVVDQPIKFDASLSIQCIRTIVSYTWNFDDGTGTTTTTNPKTYHAYTTPGDYNVTLTLAYSDGTDAKEWTIVHVVIRPHFNVEPPVTNVGIVNKTFDVNITLNDLDASLRTVSVQFRLCYDDTLLELVNTTEGPFMKDPRWNPYGTYFIYYVENTPAFGPNVIVGVMMMPNGNGVWPTFPSGSGTIATLTFKAIKLQRGLEKPILTCDLTLKETEIVNDNLDGTEHDVNNGMFKMHPMNIADLNFDGTVDIKDVSMVARAFGTAQGEPRYNEICDVNFDGIIDIKDIALVAHQFGWTATYDP
jgi:parallel beta-helix repeat protein